MPEYCPICSSYNGCFEQCFDEMYAWYLRHYGISEEFQEQRRIHGKIQRSS